MLIKVLFIPGPSSDNPYLNILADSLVKEGVDIGVGTIHSLFSVLSSAKNYWKPDILHLHWAHPFLLARTKAKTLIKSITFVCELIILKFLRIKIIWTIHNIVSHEKNFAHIELFFNQFIAKLCNKLIVHSQFAIKEVEFLYKIRKPKITIVPHINYIKWYKNSITESQAREKLQLGEKDRIYLYFGQIRTYKGVAELISTFKRLNCPHAKLLIVGIPYSDEVAENILFGCEENENIKTYLGFVPDADIQVYMNAADAVVLPYKEVLTSGVILLAISFSKVIIAPSIGCIPDILDEQGGILYNPSEKDGLLKAMQLVVDTNGEDLRRMGLHNFELAKRFNSEDTARKTCDTYKECLAKK